MEIPDLQTRISDLSTNNQTPVILQGRKIRLEPYNSQRDSEVLFSRLNGEPYSLGPKKIEAYDSNNLIWKLFPGGPFNTLQDLQDYVQKRSNNNSLIFTAFDQETNSQVGLIGKINSEPENLRVEIGSVVFCLLAKGTHACLEANYLILGHLFRIGFRAVVWRTAFVNEKSRNAALRAGFVLEMVRNGDVIGKGHLVDVAHFRILDFEWPEIKSKLERILYNIKDKGKVI